MKANYIVCKQTQKTTNAYKNRLHYKLFDWY